MVSASDFESGGSKMESGGSKMESSVKPTQALIAKSSS